MPCAALLALAATALATAPAHAAARAPAAPPAGVWAGSYSLPARFEATAAAVELRRRGGGWRALVSLAPGHVARVDVAARVSGGRVRFAVPGRPAPLVFHGRLAGRRLAGTATQGAAHGTFSLGRRASWGAAGPARLVGTYALASGRRVAVSAFDGAVRLLDAGTGTIRRLTAAGPSRYAIGAGLDLPRPSAGEARFAPDGSSLSLRTAAGTDAGRREAVRQLEVRFPGAGGTLAGTLTLPAGPGPHPAVAWVHGSGPARRDHALPWLARLVGEGIAVLAYDKRGVGQSTGRYPGEAATPASVDAYARDADASLRWLASQPDVDRTRLGLLGASQAGWIIPLAASRSPLARFGVALVGPTVTVGEQQFYSSLTTQGETTPLAPPDSISSQLAAAGPSGFDPVPSIRRLDIPMLWLFGAVDQHVPTRESVAILERLAAERPHDFSWSVFPEADHGLIVVPSGLQADHARSPGYAPGLLDTLAAWLRARLARA